MTNETARGSSVTSSDSSNAAHFNMPSNTSSPSPAAHTSLPSSANPTTGPATNGGRFLTWLLLITLLGFGIRCWDLETPAFDHDETFEYLKRSTSLSELTARHDGFPPLYRWIVSGIAEATGSYQSIRWFSVVVGTLTIPLVGFLGRRLLDARAGLFGALLLATSANHVLLSQYARPYCFYVLLSGLMILAAWRIRRDDSWLAWGTFLVLSWLTIATHYYGGLLLLIFGGLLLIEKRGAAWKRTLAAAGVMVLIGLPLCIPLKADMADTGEFYHQVEFDVQAYAFSYLWLITGNTFGPSVSELREMGGGPGIKAMLPWAMMALVPLLGLAIAAWQKLKGADRAWLLVLMLIPQPLTLMTASIAPTGFNYRYFVWMVIPLMVILGGGAAFDRRKPWLTFCTLALIGIGMFAITNRHYDARYAENDFHSVVKLIETEAIDEVPAVLAAPLYYGEGVLFTLPEEWLSQNITSHPSGEQDWAITLPEFVGKMGERKEGWLVMQWFPEGHPQRAITDQLAKRLEAEFVERISSTVVVYKFATAAVR